MHYRVVFGTFAESRLRYVFCRTVRRFGVGRNLVSLAEGVLRAAVERASVEGSHLILLRVIVFLLDLIFILGFWNDFDLTAFDDSVLPERLPWIGPPDVVLSSFFLYGVHWSRHLYMYRFRSPSSPLLIKIRILIFSRDLELRRLIRVLQLTLAAAAMMLSLGSLEECRDSSRAKKKSVDQRRQHTKGDRRDNDQHEC